MAETMTLHELRAALVGLFPDATICADAQCWRYRGCGEYVTQFRAWVDHGTFAGKRFEASTPEGVLSMAKSHAERNADNEVTVSAEGGAA